MNPAIMDDGERAAFICEKLGITNEPLTYELMFRAARTCETQYVDNLTSEVGSKLYGTMTEAQIQSHETVRKFYAMMACPSKDTMFICLFWALQGQSV